MIKELWKPIEGYEGLYSVSTLGRIKSYHKDGLVLKPRLKANGYLQVVLQNGKPKHVSIHRLVARAFIPNPEELSYVNHIDGDKTNNNIDNLEWCTASQNMLHAMHTGLFPEIDRSKDKPHVRLTEEQKEELRTLMKETDMTQVECAKTFNVCEKTVRNILKEGGTDH